MYVAVAVAVCGCVHIIVAACGGQRHLSDCLGAGVTGVVSHLTVNTREATQFVRMSPQLLRTYM